MSKVFKAVGKIFKKVIKFVVKIAPYALAAAAVVFTGGAALGLLPTFGAAVGGLVSSLGLSTALTGALTGAITSAGFGAAIGGVLGGKKGLKAGFIGGLLTGGVMGAFSPSTFGIVKGLAGQTTTMNTIAHGGNAFGAAGKGAFTPTNIGGGQFGGVAKAGTGGMMPPPAALPAGNPAATATTAPRVAGPAPAGLVPPSAPTPTIPTAGGMTAAPTGMAPAGFAPTSSGGIGGFLSQNPGLAGNLLQSVGGALGGGGGGSKKYKKKLKAELEAKLEFERKEGLRLFGGTYTGNPDPFGMANVSYAVPLPRFYYDQKTNAVVDRQQQPQQQQGA